MAAQNPVLTRVRPNGLDDMPEYQINIDQEKAATLGLSLGDVNSAISTIFGSIYVNDFIDKGRVKKVFMQGDAPFRMQPEDIGRWFLRNTNTSLNAASTATQNATQTQSQNQNQNMVPLSAISTAEWRLGSPKLERFNGQSSVALLGEAAPGHSTGQAMEEIIKMAKALPAGVDVEWAGLSYEERLAGSKTLALYGTALVLVFLCLAALYESWAIPFAVMMDMPLGALGVLVATSLRSYPNDVYFQIGLITIIGLSAKNAILVVEFAKESFDKGATLIDAALHAVRQRLRPILMTSLAFGFGVLPLALSHGAGSGSQNAIGTGIVGGALTTTLLGLFFVPLYFVTVLHLFRVKPTHSPDDTAPPTDENLDDDEAPEEKKELVNA
jgi:multidrug efflux pump subunit AcrB